MERYVYYFISDFYLKFKDDFIKLACGLRSTVLSLFGIFENNLRLQCVYENKLIIFYYIGLYVHLFLRHTITYYNVNRYNVICKYSYF